MTSPEMTTVSRRRLMEAFGALGLVGAAGAATQIIGEPGDCAGGKSCVPQSRNRSRLHHVRPGR